MDNMKHKIERQLVANVIIDKCAHCEEILFSESWCTQERCIRFTLPIFRALFPPKQNAGDWDSGDFVMFEFVERFDVIYSTLTFMHIEDKLSAIRQVAELLNCDGLFVLSIDKNQNSFIDMGTRKIKIYPDTPENTINFIRAAGLHLTDKFDTEHAYVFVSTKGPLV